MKILKTLQQKILNWAETRYKRRRIFQALRGLSLNAIAKKAKRKPTTEEQQQIDQAVKTAQAAYNTTQKSDKTPPQ
ncbi:MAG: hypothetical protein VXY83_05135 [Pseudomonadota bacterium]|nr:hypothetical protein [Pseudomonadota bacterium]